MFLVMTASSVPNEPGIHLPGTSLKKLISEGTTNCLGDGDPFGARVLAKVYRNWSPFHE